MDKTNLEYYQKGKLKLDVILTNRCNLQCSARNMASRYM